MHRLPGFIAASVCLAASFFALNDSLRHTLTASPNAQKRNAVLRPTARDGRENQLLLAQAPTDPISNDLDNYFPGTAQVVASQRIEIRSQATGYLKRIHFHAGQIVKKGDLLFEIDSRLQQAELQKAAAALEGAEARTAAAQSKRNRLKDLQKANAVEANSLEQSDSEVQAAQVDREIAKVNLEIAKIRLSYATIVAPISGRIDRPKIDAGNLVNADATILGVLSRNDPSEIVLELPQGTWIKLRKRIRQGQFPNSHVPVEVSLDQSFQNTRAATLETLDGEFDADAGAMRLRAVFPNADGEFVAGMLVFFRLHMKNTPQTKNGGDKAG